MPVVINIANNMIKLLQEQEKEFDEKTNHDNVGNTDDEVMRVEDSLYGETMYPESMFELCPDKLKAHIKQNNIALIKKVIDIMENSTYDHFEDVYNQLDAVISSLEE